MSARAFAKKRAARDRRRRITRGPLSWLSTRDAKAYEFSAPLSGVRVRYLKKKTRHSTGSLTALRRLPRKGVRVRLRNGELSPLPFHDVGPKPVCDKEFASPKRFRFEAEMIISPFVNVVNR